MDLVHIAAVLLVRGAARCHAKELAKAAVWGVKEVVRADVNLELDFEYGKK